MYFCHPFRGYNQSEIARRVCGGKYKFPTYLKELDFIPKATQAQGPVRPQLKKIRKPISGMSSQAKSAKQERVYHHYSSDLIHVVQLLLQVNPVLRPTTQEILNFPSVKKRLSMLDQFMEKDSKELSCGDLLSTIKIPKNLRNVNLPDPTYNKDPDLIKPIEKRMHVKKGAPLKKELNVVNSPEMKLITDYDWWAPTKSCNELKSDDDDSLLNDDLDDLVDSKSNNNNIISEQSNSNNSNENNNEVVVLNDQVYAEFEAGENRKIMTPKRPRSSPCRKNVNRAPRNYKPPVPPMQFPKDKKRVSNPRFKLPIIR